MIVMRIQVGLFGIARLSMGGKFHILPFDSIEM